MKIFVAGATGALGKQLVPKLVANGHDVVGMTHSPDKQDAIRALGARPVLADGLDAEAVGAAVAEAEPEVVVHQMTALSGEMDPRDFAKTFAETNRLRTEGLDNLPAAARAVGAKLFVAQSFAGWPFARIGGPVKTEEDPLDEHPPEAVRETLEAIKRLEEVVTNAEGIEGIALRYVSFYGPGTSLSLDPPGQQTQALLDRKLPVVGKGTGVWSLIHIADAADATVAAIEHGKPGVYQVADDEPARVAEMLPALAEAAGAKPPRHIPAGSVACLPVSPRS